MIHETNHDDPFVTVAKLCIYIGGYQGVQNHAVMP